MWVRLRKATGRHSEEESGLASAYTNLRGSKLFLLSLVSIIVGWIAAHFFLGIDREWGALNLMLSSEASIALAFFTMIAHKQDKNQADVAAYHQKQLEYILEIATAVHAIVAELSEREIP